DYHRLKKIDYPETQDITYTYGDKNATNNKKGRLIKTVDESGEKEYSYGKLGEVIKVRSSLKSLNPAITEPYIFEEESLYDYLGRVEWIKYADGETLHYEYNKGGQVNKVYGKHYDYTFNYVKTINYDQFGQRTYIRYGNNVETTYTYDPARRWLDNINTQNASGKIFQNVNYDFDKVGNIKEVENSGTNKYTKQTYKYDDLYQLTEARGEYIDRTTQALPKTYKYYQKYQYDNIGNMTHKTSTRTASPRNNNPALMNYTNSYIYDTYKPHQANKIGQFNYYYDNNGNQTRKHSHNADDNNEVIDENIMENTTENMVIDGNIMEHHPEGYDPDANQVIDDNIFDDANITKEKETCYLWNEENKLKEVDNSKGKTYYLYNSGGEATVEKSKTGETIFISKYISLKNEDVFTKHIYVGTTRLASKLGNRGDGAIDLAYEKRNTYYVHGDHLGSANWITNHEGKEYRHYISSPYGEEFIKEGEILGKIGYSFTGQRESESTGLIAFPQRFYNATINRWLSVDSALPSYIGNKPDKLPGEGGVFNPINLNVYHYCNNNPINYTDPTGEWPLHISIKLIKDDGFIPYKLSFAGSGWSNNAPQWLGGYNDGFDGIMGKIGFNIHGTKFKTADFTLRLWKGDYNWGGQGGGEIGFYKPSGWSFTRKGLSEKLGLVSTTMNVYKKSDNSLVTGYTEKKPSFWTHACCGENLPKEDLYSENIFRFKTEKQAMDFFKLIDKAKGKALLYDHNGNELIKINQNGNKVNITWGKPEDTK
ncbi:MAG: hypothetical protein K8S14_01140, partial [Actinomycetia bacterium]|nr:hypothetical protein [Actinomycetes bacterium]